MTTQEIAFVKNFSAMLYSLATTCTMHLTHTTKTSEKATEIGSVEDFMHVLTSLSSQAIQTYAEITKKCPKQNNVYSLLSHFTASE